MNNTHALLLAFIDASGYEVEELMACDEPAYYAAVNDHNAYITGGGNNTWSHPEQRDFMQISGYSVMKKKSDHIKCMGCGTMLGNNAPLDSCLCGRPEFLVRES